MSMHHAVMEIDGVFVCDIPRRPTSDTDFWDAFNCWMCDLKAGGGQLLFIGKDVIFFDAKDAMLYMFRWFGSED